jgi:prepilin-type N-terminal cleavage/methylation domain-containing protein
MMMNGSGHHPIKRSRRTNGFTLIELLVVIAVIFILISSLVDRGEAVIAVAGGWCFHLRRLMEEATLDVAGTLTALVTFALLAAGIHGFARGWQNVRSRETLDGAARRPWKWRWSLAITLGIVMLAAAGIAAVSLAHQTIWLVSGPPVFTRGPGWK